MNALVVILCIVGLALVVFGSDILVDGASSIARRFGVSEFVIGLTIVGFGTSCPELVVSLTGAFEGAADISIGNVVGSNIFNTLLILGLTAVLSPIAMTRDNKRRDIPIMLGVTVLLVGFYFAGVLRRSGGVLFLCVFALYMVICFHTGKSEDTAPEKDSCLAKALAMTAAGLAALIGGGRMFVDNAVEIARAAGVSDKFIAVTLLAGGTSLPELATCIIAAAKKKGQLALGNIIGSNVFNILLILGCSSLVCPLSFDGMNPVDMGALCVSALLLLSSAYIAKKDAVDRFDGIVMLLCEAAYLAYLFRTL